jgi:uncharacterized protein (TIGR03083 family)
MELTRPQIVTGLLDEYESFASLTSGLSAADWDAPTRCPGWAVRHVAGHVTGNAVDSARGAIGTRTPDEQARDLHGHDPAGLAALLMAAATRMRAFLRGLDDDRWSSPSPVPGRTIGNGVLTLWYDAFVHGDDIRFALGQPGRGGPGLAASVLWVRAELERKGWHGARLLLDGLDEITIGPGGPVVRGDPLRFVLAAAGRANPAELGLADSINVYR